MDPGVAKLVVYVWNRVPRQRGVYHSGMNSIYYDLQNISYRGLLQSDVIISGLESSSRSSRILRRSYTFCSFLRNDRRAQQQCIRPIIHLGLSYFEDPVDTGSTILAHSYRRILFYESGRVVL